MISKVLQLIKNNGAFASRFNPALSTLYDLKVLEFLHLKGRPQIVSLGADVNIMASQASYVSGYQDALNDLEDFIEKFILPSTQDRIPPPDYGGVELALARGDLDKEEADGLKNTGNTKG